MDTLQAGKALFPAGSPLPATSQAGDAAHPAGLHMPHCIRWQRRLEDLGYNVASELACSRPPAGMIIRSPIRPLLVFAMATASASAQLLPMVQPNENPTTPEKVMLGKFLFWEEQLSSDDSVACGTCHQPEFGGGEGRLPPAINPGFDGVYGTPDDVFGSSGVVRQTSTGDFRPTGRFGLDRQVTDRASPTNIGAGHHNALFWDTRASSTFVDPETNTTAIAFGGALESQSLAPILSAAEMATEGRTWDDVRNKLQQAQPMRLATNLPPDMASALQQNPTYPLLFQAAFGDPAINARRIAFALGSYQRTLNPDQTPWDDFTAGNTAAMTPLEQQGWQLFTTTGRCNACHWDPFFSDDLVHNLGLRPNAEDVGAIAVTGFPFDLGAFKTPTLRNSGLRTRLFHNGQSVALDDPAQLTDATSTLNIYLNGGGVETNNLDPFLQNLSLLGVSANDLDVMQKFVSTALTDPRTANRLPPFDHPDLRSTAVAPPRVFGPSLAGANEPFLIDTLPTFPGNFDYRLGLAGGTSSALSLLTFGFQSFEPSLTVAGLPWNVDVFDYRLFALSGQPGQIAHATLPMPIPNNTALQLYPLYLQLFVQDPVAPGGISASQGWEFVIR